MSEVTDEQKKSIVRCDFANEVLNSYRKIFNLSRIYAIIRRNDEEKRQRI